MMRHKINFVLAMSVITLSMLIATTAQAGNPQSLGTFGEWTAYSFTENGNKVCYMASQPNKAEGNYTRRGDVFALITHRPSEKTKNVFSYMTGYGYKPGSDATIKIGDRSFTLFTQDETAWAPDPQTDDLLTDAIRKGINMIVKGTSGRGTVTTDTFSLKGSAAAHDAISKACGIR